MLNKAKHKQMSKQKLSKNEAKKLTPKQKRFCEEYVIDLNATQAAVRAGYSKKTANEQGARLLVNVSIQNYISELQKDIQERNKITVDECVSILANIARLDIADLFNEEGGLKPIHQIPKEARTAIASLESEQLFDYMDGEKIPAGVLKKVRTANKEGVIDKLMKHLGGYEEHNRQKQINFNLSNVSDSTIKDLLNASNGE